MKSEPPISIGGQKAFYPFRDLPLPTKKVSTEAVERTFQQIQEETRRLVERRLDHMRNSPTLSRLIIHPKVGGRRRKQNKW
jgi:hypothetical protein